MRRLALSARSVALGSLVSVLALAMISADAANGGGGSLATKHQVASESKALEGADEISRAADQYAASRVAPGSSVSVDAFTAARAAAAALPRSTSTSWTELTTQPYDSDNVNFRDPFISNSGGGAGLSAGRMSALAVDPARPSLLYAGAAAGGVWKSTDADRKSVV